MSHPYSQLSADLKRKCLDYISDHLMDDFDAYLSEEKYDYSDKKYSQENFVHDMDHFLLFGETEFYEPVLEVIEKNLRLNKEEKSVLEEWRKEAINSVFDILEVDKDHLRLRDLVSEAEFTVYTNNDEFPPEIFPAAKEREFLYTNLLPVHGVWFLSGTQNLLGRNLEETIFRKFIQKQPPENCYRHNPEKLRKAFELQKEHYDCFVSTFGADEVIVNGRDVAKIEDAFFRAWYEKKNLPYSPVKINLPSEILDSDEVGVVMDEREGTHYFEEYGKFRKIFSEEEKISEEQEEIFKGYLINDEIPAFVFRRMKERYPEKFKKVIKKLIPRSMFRSDPITDFDSLMDLYKPFWREIFPSVHPLNQYFKKYYYQQSGLDNKVGRNDPCPCGSGLKFKKCCGK